MNQMQQYRTGKQKLAALGINAVTIGLKEVLAHKKRSTAHTLRPWPVYKKEYKLPLMLGITV